jgi:hypothetical protein
MQSNRLAVNLEGAIVLHEGTGADVRGGRACHERQGQVNDRYGENQGLLHQLTSLKDSAELALKLTRSQQVGL